MMLLPLRVKQGLLIILLVNVAVTYSLGMSPVFGLIGIILLTTSILAHQFRKEGRDVR